MKKSHFKLQDIASLLDPRHRPEMQRRRAQTCGGTQKNLYGGGVYNKASFYRGVYSKTYKKAPTDLSPIVLLSFFCAENCSSPFPFWSFPPQISKNKLTLGTQRDAKIQHELTRVGFRFDNRT